MEDLSQAESEHDRETLVHNLALMDHLKARYPEFYPSRSPYFRDIRDTGD
jgi:DNA primase